MTNHRKNGKALKTVVNLNTIEKPINKLPKTNFIKLKFFSLIITLNNKQIDIINNDMLKFSDEVLLCKKG